MNRYWTSHKKGGTKLYITLMMLASGTISAQDNSGSINVRNNYFYVSPADLFLNTFELGYERMFRNSNSFFLQGALKLSRHDDYFDRLGGKVETQYRINLHYNRAHAPAAKGKFMSQAYFAPYLLYRYEKITEEWVTEPKAAPLPVTIVNSGFAGVGFGIRLTGLESRFCLNFFAGGGLKYADINGPGKYNDLMMVGYTGIAPKVSFQMGIAF